MKLRMLGLFFLLSAFVLGTIVGGKRDEKTQHQKQEQRA